MTVNQDETKKPKLNPMENVQKEDNSSEQNTTVNPNDQPWGFDLYPERRGERPPRNWLKTIFLMEGRESIDRIKCEKNIYECVQKSPLVKLLIGALKSAGCDFDIGRHVSCEICKSPVTGGYDPEMNQVIVCQNSATSKGWVQGVLIHEMIHMFDYCTHKLDFKNIDHLACTEVRAANLAHCSFLSAVTQGSASPFNIKKAHQDCVKYKAMLSVQAVHKVSEKVAMEAVERVFSKCYSDLEPIGRRIRRKSLDMEKAYIEAPLYGYDV